ncbi:MAG: nucleotide exchange factor GrpE [Lachnospiraceae bacterium]|nr:nucleotide exchange factor GrpE [Lachnospiraceae bacterium]
MLEEEKKVEEQVTTDDAAAEVVAEENVEEIEQESAETTTEDAEVTEDKGDKKAKKEKKNKKNEVEEKLKAEIEELKDKDLRRMAEFENYRKRTEKEKQSMFETGAKSVIEKLLPIVDNFERGFQGLSEEELASGFAQGMQMTYKQLMGELEKLEVKPIEAVGQEFNPDLHNAVMHIEDESLGENVIAQELQKGYTYRDQVIRYSMVQVAN